MNELYVTEYLEALNSLKYIKEQLLQLENDNYRWKWIIIALHNSLQNFMVCVLRGSNNLDVLTNKTSDKLLSELNFRMKVDVSNWNDPEGRLDNFSNLFEKIQSDKMLKYFKGKKLEPTDTQKFYINTLNDLRNKFIHFIPQGWSLTITKLPDLTLETINIIYFLAFESRNFRWKEISQKEDTQKLLNEIKIILEKLKSEYNKN